MDRLERSSACSEAVRFRGPSLSDVDLSEELEHQIVLERGPMLASFGPVDGSLDPVVLVHGINGAPRDLSALAARLRGEGRQVFFFLYDDRGVFPSQNGLTLARELRLLRTVFPRARTLQIVAHSMGGIVSRAALNYLERPSWLGGPVSDAALPCAGFPEARLMALDTPWDGFAHEPVGIPVLSALLAALSQFFMWLFGWSSLFEMRGSSELMARLHGPLLNGVTVENIVARQSAGEADRIQSIDDLSTAELNYIVQFCRFGTPPEELRLRNMCSALGADLRFAELRRRVQASPSAEGLRQAYECLFCPVTASHADIAQNSIVVDRVVSALSPDRKRASESDPLGAFTGRHAAPFHS